MTHIFGHEERRGVQELRILTVGDKKDDDDDKNQNDDKNDDDDDENIDDDDKNDDDDDKNQNDDDKNNDDDDRRPSTRTTMMTMNMFTWWW